MPAVLRIAAVSAILFALLVMPGTARVTQADEPSPAAIADQLDSALFDIQSGLLGEDITNIPQSIAAAEGAVESLVLLPGVDATEGQALSDFIAEVRAAALSGNDQAVAMLRGQIRGSVLRISFAASLSAVAQGDADTAASWLLIRSFSPASRLARPSADSALAIQALRNGAMSSADAEVIVRADLLDTYQGEVRRQLEDALDSAGSGRLLAAAEALGRAQSLWPLLAPSYGEQVGAAPLADLNAQFMALTTTKSDELANSVPILIEALDTFRAAPLSADEQSGRARQIMLYLGLVPVEYKRGVRGGEVVADIEIQEAITFLDGARMAFSDLRPTLNATDPVAATAIASQFAALDKLLADTANRRLVSEPELVKEMAGSIESATRALVPSEWLKAGGNADFDVVISLLEQMEAAASSGQYQQAESARLEAYAIYDMGAEKRLLAFAPGLAQTIEVAFWQGSSGNPGLATLIANRAPVTQISRARVELVRDLSEARQRLGAGSTARGAIIFNSASIVFREGLEAVLILASLLASMTGQNRALKRPLAYGALMALGATALLFVLARTVLMSLSAYSERVEAVVSILAIAVLLLVMNWFFHKVYWTKWIAKHHDRRRVIIGGISGQVLGLVLLGFTSVFREGAETVLFLQALVLDAGTMVVIQGTALGLIGVAIVGVLMFRLQAKLPHKKMLMVTGVMISVVLVTMVGKTVHVLQAVGWAPIHPIGEWAPPYWMSVWLGIFPTWEAISMQLVAIVFVFGSYFAAERSHERARQKRYAQSELSTAAP